MRKAVGDYGPVASIYIADAIVLTLVPPYFSEVMGYDVWLIGVLTALSAIASIAATVPSGLLYTARRARHMVMISLAIAAAATALYPFVDTVLAFAVLRMAGGGALGLANTIYLALFIESQPPGPARSKALGYFSGAVAVGYSVGNLMGGVAGEYLGYPLGFLLGALMKLIALGTFALRPAVQGGHLAVVHAEGGSLAERLVKPFAVAAREPRLASLAMVGFFLSSLHGLHATFFPLYVRSVGLRVDQLGVLRAAYSLTNAVARPLAGQFIYRLGHHRVAYAGLTLQSAFMMLVPGFTQFVFLLPLQIATGAMRAMGMVANTIALAEDVDYGRINRGVASAVFNGSKELGHVAGPILGGALASALGLPGLFLAGTALMLLSFGAGAWAVHGRTARVGAGAT